MKETNNKTKELQDLINSLISQHNTDGPFFYDEGVCEILYVPIEVGELRVFHHKPQDIKTKRPVLFIPGFGTSPWSWRYFSTPFYQKGEYYFLETREKTSSKIKKSYKTKMSVDQKSQDVGEVIKYLQLDKQDFVLFGASYCGGVVLNGLIKKYFTAPTIINFDPLESFKNHKKLAATLTLFPPFALSLLKNIIANILLIGMKNKLQKERIFDYLRNADAWKWRKSGKDNLKFDIEDSLQFIEEEVSIFHGPLDRYHPDFVFENIAAKMPLGRYFYMNTADEYRELLAGIIGYEFSKVTKENGIPESLQPFEIKDIRKKEKRA
ncbi:MAG TPA: alpha/beta hydrolase [candidate division Zixibacteria bacterium]|nr:alpha/beta hydrolase [candidate division Zixibacteria bacterium]